jgi:DNA-binding LacI/PurR family transcriptional regulator
MVPLPPLWCHLPLWHDVTQGERILGTTTTARPSQVPARATSFDIAYLAGVSQPTVSRALRGSPDVNESTRQRIEAIAKQLNYKVDKNASNLRFQHSNTLALLFFEDPTPDDSQINPFFLSMLGSITRSSARRGYDLLISFQQLSGNWHVDFEDSKKADGIILLGYGDYLQYRSRLEQLSQQGTHFVRWGAVQPGQPGISIGCDNHQGGRDVTAHLIRHGRRDIAFLGHACSAYPEFLERYRGYEQALQIAGLCAPPALQVDAVVTEQAGYAAACELMSRQVRFDAIFAACDLIAIGAMRALQEHGIAVPDTVAVVGFDDISAASMSHPALTTVAQDTHLAGETLVDTLLRQIRGEAATGTMLPARLVVRSSCGACAPAVQPGSATRSTRKPAIRKLTPPTASA